MKVMETKFDDVYLIEPNVYQDTRGFFMESFNQNDFRELGVHLQLLQDNHSLSVDSGTIRGLHYQLNPYAQLKIVRVIAGAIYDVIVDIRSSSPTFGKWQGFILTADNFRQIIIPKGFAHGFCTLVKNTEVLYKVDQVYAPEYERGILWNDTSLNVDWPTTAPILSEKDRKHPALQNAELNF